MAESVVKILTPKGTAVYPNVQTPNKKFEPNYGTYDCTVRLSAEAAQPLIAQLDALMDQSFAEAQEKNKGKRVKRADVPYKETLDKEGNPTGEYDIKAKAPAGGVTKDGKKWERKIPVFDSKGKRIVGDIKMGSGSQVKVSAEARPFYVPTLGAGVSLRLSAVMVYELREFGSGASADSYGFTTDEDGYEFTADDVHTPVAEEPEDNTDGVPDFV